MPNPVTRDELNRAIRHYANSLVDAVNASDAFAQKRHAELLKREKELDALLDKMFVLKPEIF